MEERPQWLPYHAKDGIVETFFGGDGTFASFSSYVERAMRWSQSTVAGSYRLLDTFLSDSLSSELLSKLFSLSDLAHPTKILIVDPESDFALARARSIGQVAAKEVRTGLVNVLSAIKEVARIDLPDLSAMTFDELVILTCNHSSRVNLEVRYYTEVPSGPLYFFKDILLSGRFCAGSSSRKLPWAMIVDDPHFLGDLYDIYSSEFERIWGTAKTNPEQRRTIRGSALTKEPFDLAIITATEVEWKALLEISGVHWERLDEISEGGAIFYASTFERAGRKLSVVATRQSEPGMVCAAISTTKLLQFAKVNFLATIGICAAVPRRTQIGSVVIASQVFDAQAGKWLDGTFDPNIDSITLDVGISQTLRDRAHYYAAEAESACAHLPHPKRGIKVAHGKVATVSQVIADSVVAEKIWRQSRQCIALEMESYGIFRAAVEASTERRPRMLFIKTAADNGDFKKADRYQAYCARVSAHILWNFSLDHLAK